MPRFAKFFNASLCIQGQLVDRPLYIDLDSGLIAGEPEDTSWVVESYDLRGHVIAPAYLELQTNGCAGFHFTNFTDSNDYQMNLRKVAHYLLSTGVGSFWATIPTVKDTVFKAILPELYPQTFGQGVELLGAHCEGPFLNPLKKGAHVDYRLDSSLMQWPSNTTPEDIYGPGHIKNIKMVTLAPELSGAMGLIARLAWEMPDGQIIVSLGHSNADYNAAAFAFTCGASALTHVFNAMTPFNHRDPGLAGTISSRSKPYFSIIADGIHLHPSVVSLAFRANPERCMLITDSIEMAGLPDGIYPGHAQIPFDQEKKGNKVTIKGTDTLIGSCIGIDECVRNLVKFSGCTLAQAVRCATENIASLMRLSDRGVLRIGKRADFVIMDQAGFLREVWLKGKCMCSRPQTGSKNFASTAPPARAAPSRINISGTLSVSHQDGMAIDI